MHPGGGIKCAQAKWARDSEIMVIGVKEEEIIDSCFRDVQVQVQVCSSSSSSFISDIFPARLSIGHYHRTQAQNNVNTKFCSVVNQNRNRVLRLEQ